LSNIQGLVKYKWGFGFENQRWTGQHRDREFFPLADSRNRIFFSSACISGSARKGLYD
jgi:hypothetical protein